MPYYITYGEFQRHMKEYYLRTGNKMGTINNNVLKGINGIDAVHGAVSTIDSNLKVVYDQVDQLARDFHDYVK